MSLLTSRTWWIALVLAASACGGATSPGARPAPRPLGALITLVPAESALVVVARPAALFGDAATGRVLRALFPADQLDRFAQRSGVDPRALDELVIAEHDDGRVVLARGAFDAPFAVREAGARMAPTESSVDAPFVRRVGFLGGRRVDVSALSSSVVLWVEGAPQLAGRVLAAAERSPPSRRHGLERAMAARLREATGDAPFALYALRPLGLPRETGVGMLLARQRALAMAARATDENTLALALELRGEFPNGAAENFRALARSVSETDLGAALGARDAMPTLRIEAESRRVRMTAELDPALVAAGLRMFLSAEMEELLGDDTGLAGPLPSGRPPDQAP